MMKLFQRHYGEKEPAIIILHGILGSGRNWHTAAKIFAEHHRVIVPDLRNHGHSPHDELHHTAGLVDDFYALQQDTNSAPCIVLGHSLGGLIACEAAFHSSTSVQALIVVDIVPRAQRSPVMDILATMGNIDLSSFKSRHEIDDHLALLIPDPLVRQFILTNLKTTLPFRWRANLPALRHYLIEMQTYRPAPMARYNGPALFIRGERSEYIREQDETHIHHHFPQAKITTIPEAGHWVHYDNLPAMVAEIRAFLEKLF